MKIMKTFAKCAILALAIGGLAVLALTFSATYWDYLGWKDIFAKPEFTERQEVYEPALGEQGPFTPQMAIDGRELEIELWHLKTTGPIADWPQS